MVSASTWAYTIAAVLGVSLLSFVGAAVLLVHSEVIRRSILVLISFSVGALLGDAILHVLPDLAQNGGLSTGISFVILGGMAGFFVLEKVLHWHHAHVATEDVIHPVAVANLVGDGIHNFVDGAIVAGAFLASTPLGVTTALAVALHEIPQEIGDMGILLLAGLTPRRALWWNFVSALTAVVGAIITLLLAEAIGGLDRPLLALTAGGFLYIAGADLIPELQRETRIRSSLAQLAGITLGVAVMGLLLLIE